MIDMMMWDDHVFSKSCVEELKLYCDSFHRSSEHQWLQNLRNVLCSTYRDLAKLISVASYLRDVLLFQLSIGTPWYPLTSDYLYYIYRVG